MNDPKQTPDTNQLGVQLEKLTFLPERKISRAEYHDPYTWEFTKELEANWKTVKEEFENVQKSLLHPWPEKNLYEKNGKTGEGWDVFGLYAFGKKHYRNAKLCPVTLQLVEKIQGMTTAAFSILNPKSQILPHVGYYGYSEMVLRCHLGLTIPKDCYLLVNDKKGYWEQGKCMVFDDTYVHSAVNNSDEQRVILLLDFGVGIPVDDQNLIKGKDGENSDSDEDDIVTLDQKDYLDFITSAYGYGVKDKEESSDNKNNNVQ